MRNVNFSADMVGIQTLAQQGAVCGSESVLSSGITEGCSFDDMILQMIANNLTIEPKENTEQISDGVFDESSKNPQEVIMDALMCGMVTPEISIQDFSKFYADDMSVQTADISDAPVEIGAVSGDASVLSGNEAVSVLNRTANTTKNTVADVNYDTKTDFSQTIQTSDKVDYVQNTEPVNNNIPKSDEVKAETEIKTEMKADNKVSVNDKTEFSDFQIRKPYTKTDISVRAESGNSESETAEDALSESFISTADMLQMRAGNKIDFSNERVAFKVAQPPINMESPNAVKELTDRILMKFNEKEFEVELYPKSLGKIAISLVLDNGIVKVAMNAENAKVNAFLASQSANIQSIVEKNTQYSAVVKVDDSQNQYQQQQRDNSQYGADENQKQRQQEHMQQMYRQNIQHTEDFLSMLSLV